MTTSADNSNYGKAMLPPKPPVAFPEPVVLNCRREAGTIMTSQHAVEAPVQLRPRLERRASMTADIIVVDPVEETSRKTAYLLQRKIRESTYGSVRIGFLLRKAAMEEGGDKMWEVVPSTGLYPYEMVAIKMESLSRMQNGRADGEEILSLHYSSETEKAALQMVTADDPMANGHVLSQATVAKDPLYVYTITPYHLEGSLYDLCAARKTLSENDARFFFRQILEGLGSLMRLGICHRSLASEHILLRGHHCFLAHLGNALRVPTEGGDSTGYYLIEGQTPTGTTPEYVAPELFSSQPFDGYAVDLWAAGVILFKMVLVVDSLFATPVEVDPRFREICLAENLKGIVRQWEEASNTTPGVSDQLLDLLQAMLLADPDRRLTLSQVMEHPWVVAEGIDVQPPDIQREFVLGHLHGDE